MKLEIVNFARGIIELRFETPADAEMALNFLKKFGHRADRDCTNARILFLSPPQGEFVPASELDSSPPDPQRRLTSSADM